MYAISARDGWKNRLIDYPGSNRRLDIDFARLLKTAYARPESRHLTLSLFDSQNRIEYGARTYHATSTYFTRCLIADERPDLVATRQRFGDWEGDRVEGAKGSGQITTHVERKSRYLIAAKHANKTARVTAVAVIAAFRRTPKTLRHRLTLDNGKEFARFSEIEKDTGLVVCFADPYSAWQRGSNENTNGLLRRYFPKGSDFGNVTEERLASAVKKLNHRPRKCLGYQTPHEVFQNLLEPTMQTCQAG